MAVVNIYKFAGLNANTDNTEKNPFGSGNPLVTETYLIKSIIVKSAGTKNFFLSISFNLLF